MPLSFFKSTSSLTANLVQVKQMGSIYIKTTSALPQSSTISQATTNYYSNDTQVLSMIDTHTSYNSAKNLSFFANIRSNQDIYSGTISSLTYTAQF